MGCGRCGRLFRYVVDDLRPEPHCLYGLLFRFPGRRIQKPFAEPDADP